MTDLVGNPKDKFSRDADHIMFDLSCVDFFCRKISSKETKMINEPMVFCINQYRQSDQKFHKA